MTIGSNLSWPHVRTAYRTAYRTAVRRVGANVAYLACTSVLTLVSFVLLSVAVGATATVVLAPLALPAAARGVRVAAAGERTLLRRWQRADEPSPAYPRRRPGEGRIAFCWRVVTDPQTLIDAVWAWIAWVPALVLGVITLIWWVMGLSQLLWPAYAWAVHDDVQTPVDLFVHGSYVARSLSNVVGGVVVLLIAPALTAAASGAQRTVSRAILGSHQRATALDRLRRSRDSARTAQATQLSRLERDIHDGPQQRLVRLKLDLARIERQLGPDSPAADAVRQAIASTGDTLDELRALSRGIAPPVLSDRGLVAAVRESAARALVPVGVHTNLPEQASTLPEHVELAAYYVVSEALTNVSKHSGAEAAQVSVVRESGQLTVTVLDDGVGGADVGKGAGLRGLADRVRSVDGSLQVRSPAGGPTQVAASIPLGRAG